MQLRKGARLWRSIANQIAAFQDILCCGKAPFQGCQRHIGYLACDLMYNNVYGPYYNLMQLLQRSYPVYAKTGTTDWGKDGMQYGIPEGAMKDKWMVASNSQYTNAVWVGYDMAISGKQTYFTVYKQNLNIPGNICKLLLDVEDTLSEDLPGGVEMPNDVIEQTYVYGTFPHVRMEDWMNDLELTDFEDEPKCRYLLPVPTSLSRTFLNS